MKLLRFSTFLTYWIYWAVTPHQRRCLALEAVLPHRVSDTSDQQDWLDTDLAFLLRNTAIPLEHRTAFANIITWHTAGCPTPEVIHIYTDGSAAGQANDLQPCSWAFAVFAICRGRQFLLGQAAATSFPPSEPYHLGETVDDALTAELLALCWGLGWTAQHGCRFRVPVVFWYDSKCAGEGAFGTSSMPLGQTPSSYSRLNRLVTALRHYASCRADLRHEHVYGHTGCLGNELADALARTVRQHPQTLDQWVLPTWLPALASHCLRDWAWATLPGHSDFPRPYAFEAEVSLYQSLPEPPVPAPPCAVSETTLPAAEVTFRLNCVTFNALTLKDPVQSRATCQKAGLRLLGRKEVLKRSLQPYEVHVLGLQETRLAVSEQQGDADYFIYNAAADDKSTGGCSLWLAKHRPYGRDANGPYLFRPEQITIVSSSSRHLTANVLTPRIRLHIQVIHAPSACNVTVREVRLFWQQRLREVQDRPDGTDFILLSDANAKVGSIATEAIGPHQAEQENEAGALFHEFALQIQAFVPSTCATCHEGSGGTWCSPAGSWSRLDYILVPAAWSSFELHTRVLYDVETLQSRDDHVPLLLASTFVKSLPSVSYVSSRRRALRPAIPRTTAERHQVRAGLTHIRPQPWGVDPHTHYETLVSQWVEHTVLPPPEDPAPRQTFLTPDTLFVVQLRTALRRYLASEAKERARRWKLLAFAAFVHNAQASAFTLRALLLANSWFYQLDISEARALSALYQSTRTIRRKVQADRLAHLDNLARQAATCTLRDSAMLFRSIRRAFPSTRPSRRSGFKPLPSLRLSNGTNAHTHEERCEGWRRHFAQQEAGTLVTDATYQVSFQTAAPTHRWEFDVQALPSLRQVEEVIHALQCHKAAGADAVTAEILKVDVPTNARLLLPLLAKSSLRALEPVAFRGGDLFLLAKRAANVLGCDGYRSILISSVLGKVYHRCVRQQLLPSFDDTRSPFHGGAIPGQGIDLISLAAKTFFQACNVQGCHGAIIFVDLKAAFYQVVRQLLVDTGDQEGNLRVLFQHLQLPPSAAKELRDKLAGIPILATAGVSAHTRALVRDMFRGTYFRLSGCAELTLTHRGSRPGDPAADLLFAFTLSAYFRAAKLSLRQHGLEAEFPREGTRPDFCLHQGAVDLQCPAWADDFFCPQTGDDLPNLVARTRKTVSVLATHASSLGMEVKFGPDKTAVLLPAELIARRGDLLDRQDDGTLGIRVEDAVTGHTHFLPAVHTYRHLGGILTSDSNPTPDLHYRFSQSMSVVKPLRRKLFGALRFDLNVRRNLLRSLAVTRYVHTAAALILPFGVHRRLWERHYLSIWRVLVARNAVDAQAHAYTVLRAAGAVSPPLALAYARAMCLRKLFQFGPAPMLAFLWDHWRRAPARAWLSQLQDDVATVAVYKPDIVNLLGSSSAVRGVLDSLSEDPTWWLRQVRAAGSAFLADLELWHKLRQSGGSSPPCSAYSQNYPCHICERAFPLRKHLHAHLAKAHQIYSPARHYAISEQCQACLKLFPDVISSQLHLKRFPACLMRCLYLYRPLEIAEVRRVEQEVRQRAKSVYGGHWQQYQAKGPARRVPVAFGPRLPTADERAHVALPGEEATLASLCPPYQPLAAHVVWVTDFVRGRSTEGSRFKTMPFWHRPPSAVFHH